MSREDEICVVCCCEILYYAAGACDHPVCYECSTRMRVLCEQNECPICRSDMPLVYFSNRKQVFPGRKHFSLMNTKYAIAFEDKQLQNAFEDLLQYKCQMCEQTFNKFEELDKHTRRIHAHYYCELCVEHLKIFAHERKLYSRSTLALHRRVGDKDNTSHRGHPLCEFCDRRFLDPDELYRHLRKEHYFCHFCDADGTLNGQFYDKYSDLKVHFRTFHLLCEEGECAGEAFVSAFRTEIDYKAHKALKHSKNKTKTELKQQRMLDLGFQITPRNTTGSSSPNFSDYRNKYRNVSKKTIEDDDLSSRNSNDAVQTNKDVQKVKFNTQCNQDFPHLSNDASDRSNYYSVDSSGYSNCVLTSNSSNIIKQNRSLPKPNSHHVIEDFPALASSASASTTQAPSDIKIWRKPHTFQENKISKPNTINNNNNNSGWKTSKTSKVINIEEEFPRLQINDIAPATTTAQQGAWYKPDNTLSQVKDLSRNDHESLSHQIGHKTKLKKKKKKRTGDTTENVRTSKEVAPPALSKLYMGISNHNVCNTEEDDMSLKKMGPKLYDKKIEKFKAESDWDDAGVWQKSIRFGESDFPPLQQPSVESKCPPGFKPQQKVSAPPPGFSDKIIVNNFKPKMMANVSLSSIAQQLTNNNSFEENVLFNYMRPFDFEERNSLLIDRVFDLVDENNQSFEEFKSLSINYRKGVLAASEYYFNCQKVLGEDRFLQLFMELLCLLPDIEKQQELLAVHNEFMDNLKKKGAVPKGVHFSSALLTVCLTCRQVLVRNDLGNHMQQHQDFVN